MVTPELLQYIERSLADNIPEENIRKVLVDAGWNPADAEEGIRSVKNKKAAASAPVSAIKTLPAQPTLQPASQQISKDASRLVSQALNQMSPKKSRAPMMTITLVVLLLLGGGGFAAYWYGFLPSEWFMWLPQQSQPQPQAQVPVQTGEQADANVVDTASWKTYTNEKYGFEFKYPSEWTMGTTTSSPIVSALEHADWGGASGGVFVSVTKKQSISEAQATAQKEMEDKLKISSGSPSGYPRYTMPELVTISNISAIKRSYQSYEIVPSGTDYIFPEKGLMLTLTDLYDNNQKIEVGSGGIQQAILSTFKFFEPIDTSTWKTYRSDQYGFEFKYPAEWSLYKASTLPGVTVLQGLTMGDEKEGIVVTIQIRQGINDDLNSWLIKTKFDLESSKKNMLDFLSLIHVGLQASDISANSKNISIAGAEATLQQLRITSKALIGNKLLEKDNFYVKYGTNIFAFNAFSPLASSSDTLLDAFDEAINTFKFTK